jgi:CheY-like chemotaxis protein
LPNVHGILTGRHILVIEDEALIALYLIDILEDLGASTAGPIAEVKDVLAAALQEKPDAVIMDLNLQGVSSQPIVKLLIAIGIPVILTTGYVKAHIVKRFPDLPILEKPYVFKDVIAVLSTMLTKTTDLLSRPGDAAKRRT